MIAVNHKMRFNENKDSKQVLKWKNSKSSEMIFISIFEIGSFRVNAYLDVI